MSAEAMNTPTSSAPERLKLFDGTEVEIRGVRPEDAPLVRAGFAALSPETRYLRFFAHKQELSEAEALELGHMNDADALAIGAVGAPGSRVDGMPMGVARFNRVNATTAEAAVVVVDAFQGKGLGRLLLRRISDAARDCGYERLELSALGVNRALVRLARSAFSDVEVGPVEDGVLIIEVPLGPFPRNADCAAPTARSLA